MQTINEQIVDFNYKNIKNSNRMTYSEGHKKTLETLFFLIYTLKHNVSPEQKVDNLEYALTEELQHYPTGFLLERASNYMANQKTLDKKFKKEVSNIINDFIVEL